MAFSIGIGVFKHCDLVQVFQNFLVFQQVPLYLLALFLIIHISSPQASGEGQSYEL